MINIKLTKNNKSLAAVIVLAVVFFMATSYFNLKTQDRDFVKWASPDETANYLFTKLYAETGQLVIFEKYNLYADDILRPRSMRSDAGNIKPVSFLGIILIYGKLASLFGQKIIPYLTPFFASIGIVFFYLFIKKMFGRTNALLSSVLLSLFPPYIYYTVRSMFHNVLFTVLLTIGLYFIVLSLSKIKKTKKVFNKKQKTEAKKAWYYIKFARPRLDRNSLVCSMLAGLFIGLTIITRTSELLWLAPMFVLMLAFNIKKINILNLFVFGSFLTLALLPAFYYNNILFGGALNSGYTEMNQSLENIAMAGSDIIRITKAGELIFIKDLLGKIFDNIFHFGLSPKKSIYSFLDYFVYMFPWIFWPSLLGLLLYLKKIIRKKERKKIKHKHLVYLAAYFLISVILVVYYGSWEFFDNPDKAAKTIGNSYTRYWLPVYLGLLPFMSIFIIRVTKFLSVLMAGQKNKKGTIIEKKFFQTNLRFLIIFMLVFTSVRFVLWGSSEGLFYLKERQISARAEWEKILDLTEGNSAIITLYHDKLLFPERKVIVGLFDNKEMVARYAKLAEYIPVYYYNFTLPEKDIKYLNSRRLFEAGLSINEVEKFTKDFTLYRLDLINEADSGI